MDEKTISQRVQASGRPVPELARELEIFEPHRGSFGYRMIVDELAGRNIFISSPPRGASGRRSQTVCLNKNDQGPLGIFLLQDGVSLFAHDAGNLYETSIEAVKDALKSKNDPSEQDGIVEGGGMAVD